MARMSKSGMGRLWRGQAGQGLMEYSTIGILIAVVVAVAMPPVGTAIAGMFATMAGGFP